MDALTLARLREFCRMHDRRSALFSGMLDRAVDNIFGADFDFIPRTEDREVNRRLKTYITRRMQPEAFDATGMMGFVEACHIALRAIWNDGETLWVKRPDGTVMPFEADQINTPTSRPALVTLGVEKTAAGRPAALYIDQRGHANDSGTISASAVKSARLPMQQAIWAVFRKRYGQTRGLPVIAAALNAYGRLNNYLDYESLAAEGAAMLGLKITREPTDESLAGVGDNTDAATGATFDKIQKFEPFSVWDLLPGEDVGMVNSNRPGDAFTPYTQMMCRIVGVAVGFPIELMLMDFSAGNFSSQRMALEEARRSFRRWQQFCHRKLCMPWYRWQIARGVASGELPAREDIFKANVQWPGWPYIEPYKEANANKIAVDGLQKSVSECIRARGLEPLEVFEEIVAERQWFADHGLTLTADEEHDPSGETDPDKTKPNPENSDGG
jgi:lambda family phage portal protein